MGQDICATSSAAAAVFASAETARPGITALCFEGPAERLNQTVNTQPCLYVDDLACAKALIEAGIKPEGVAGFSLGEAVACALAGVMTEQQAFEFVCRRAEAMQACTEKYPGTMFAVVRLGSDQVDAVAAEVGSVWPVNYNCPGQIVVACDEAVADALQKQVSAAGGRAIRLTVGGAFHSPLMDEAVAPLSQWLAGQAFGQATMPLYANATARRYGDAGREQGLLAVHAEVKEAVDPLREEHGDAESNDPASLLSRQVNHPVRWQQTIENMVADGFDTFVEVGPGKTLTGFIRKINSEVRALNVSDAESLRATVEELSHV
jgi:[acyl-carrier-protein] S-malonyltransferase